jgi:glycosyltransferase involved in cell wall biosynthesis
MGEELQTVLDGKAPRDRAYGMLELRAAGHEVDLSDDRFHGLFGSLIQWCRTRLSMNPIDWTTLSAIRRYDVVVAKDDFSTMLTLGCLLFRRPLIYVDALFGIPRRAWRRALTKFNIELATKTVAYSHSQIGLWSESLALPAVKMRYLPYTIDTPFYRLPMPDPTPQPAYVLSIGRDLARDFSTLVNAVKQTDLALKLVTLPHLLTEFREELSWVEVIERISYQELFKLYANASAVVIPLRKGTTYPSGVRALLEGMVLGKPVISSETPVLREYATDSQDVLFVEPENIDELRDAIVRVHSQPDLALQLGQRGQQAVRERFGMQAFSEGMLALLGHLPRSGKG